MTTADIVGIVIAVVLVAAFIAGAFRIMADRRALRERFGDEYDNVVRETGSRAAAESELRRRTRAHKRLELREIPESERARYREMWTAAQARFVDDPAAAVRDADRIVSELVADRGYPVADFSDRVAHLSVEHTRVLNDYRAGHEVAVRNDAGRATTEDLRQALVHYRAVYADVLGDTPRSEVREVEEAGIAPVPGEGGDVNALAQAPLDEASVYAPADPVLPAERARLATDAADVGPVDVSDESDEHAAARDAEARDAAVRDADVRDAEVIDAEPRAPGTAWMRGADSADAEAADAEARDAEVRDADLRDADVRDADMRDADMRDAEARDADLRDADVRDAEVRDAEARDADVRDADVRDADVRDADVRDADVRDAEARDADVRDAELADAEPIAPTSKRGAKRRVNGVRLGAAPTNTEGSDATSDAR